MQRCVSMGYVNDIVSAERCASSGCAVYQYSQCKLLQHHNNNTHSESWVLYCGYMYNSVQYCATHEHAWPHNVQYSALCTHTHIHTCIYVHILGMATHTQYSCKCTHVHLTYAFTTPTHACVQWQWWAYAYMLWLEKCVVMIVHTIKISYSNNSMQGQIRSQM